MSKTQMSQQAAARIQSAAAKSTGNVSQNSFAARAQAAAAKNSGPSVSGKK